jgi:hypothetical protein
MEKSCAMRSTVLSLSQTSRCQMQRECFSSIFALLMYDLERSVDEFGGNALSDLRRHTWSYVTEEMRESSDKMFYF